MGLSWPLFLFIYVLYTLKLNYKLKKAKMLYFGFEPGAAEWQAQSDPLCYGCHGLILEPTH